MSDTVIVALISLIGTLGGSLGGILVSSKLLSYRVDQLEKKVEKHNNLIERMYEAEKNIDVIDEQIKVVNHRISDLESKAEVI